MQGNAGKPEFCFGIIGCLMRRERLNFTLPVSRSAILRWGGSLHRRGCDTDQDSRHVNWTCVAGCGG